MTCATEGRARISRGGNGPRAPPRVAELAGDVDQFPVHLLGDADEYTEGLIGGELVPLHDDALRLPDDVPVVHPGTQVRLVLRAGQRHSGVAGEQQTDVLTLAVEGGLCAGVHVESPELVAGDEQLEAHHAAAEFGGLSCRHSA